MKRGWLLLLMLSSSHLLWGHHGPGQFNPSDTITLEGEVQGWFFRNPHAELILLDADGKSWLVETESPLILRRMGINRDIFELSQRVQLIGYRHRTNDAAIKLQRAIYGDGSETVFRTSQGAGGNTPQDQISDPDEEVFIPESIFGMWSEGDGPDWQNQQPLAITQELLENFNPLDDPVKRCRTPAFPRIVDQPLGLQIIEANEQVVFLYETFHAVRRIHLSSQRPNNMIATRMGYSEGYWDENALVVSTDNLDASLLTWDGHPVSEQATVTERYSIDQETGQLRLEITLTDEAYWQGPISREITYNWSPELPIFHYDCDPAFSGEWRIN